jgi:short subunit dehydrogenase-like uncharacterized protein
VAERIVLFGATGYTGRLTAEAMVARGLSPVLAGRTKDRLEQLAAELGGELETATADISEPRSVSELVESAGVLVTTVGPFARYGSPAAAAAATHGVHYLDSTGEPAFIRKVFEVYDEPARKSGAGMLTAFGWDYVPGALAGGVALREAGDRAVRVDLGYFLTGRNRPSGGTAATLMGNVATASSFAFRDGRVRDERTAKRVRSFDAGGKQRQAVSTGTTDHFTLPRLAPQLREVNAYLGWFGQASRVAQVMTAVTQPALKVPGAKSVWNTVAGRIAPGSSGGPDAEERAKGGSHIVAIAYDEAGEQLAEVHVTGIDGYTFTGRILAWGAERAAAGALKGAGALGAADGFGLDELEKGCAEAGLKAECTSRATSTPAAAS